ncbi:MAG: hypothetical protein INR68_01340 [Methylobacterium mesophilicum]|nr:hypothetical protein [Methylobacterium mesophilicum]
MQTGGRAPEVKPGDDELVDRFQRAAFQYFLDHADPKTGLVPDTSREGVPASVAVVGFALSAYPVGVERGWMSRGDAASLTGAALRFLAEADQSRADGASGYRGFFYHFLDMKSGRRAWNCELSMLDTALLLAGALAAAAYFGGEDRSEREIRELAQLLYDRVDWRWAQSNKQTIRHGWRPRSGFLRYGWDGYNEAAILYVLALGSTTHPIDARAYEAWASTYRWERIYGRCTLYGGPLFLDQFSHAWIDFDGIRDRYMRARRSDYFLNSRRATEVHREYAKRNPGGFKGYGEDFWGLSATDGPGNFKCSVDGRKRRFWAYKARGAPHGPDDGTVAPWSYLASLPFSPEICLSALRHLVQTYPDAVKGDRMPSGINPTLAGTRGFGAEGWVSDALYGLDQGIMVMMAENYRSGLLWTLMRGVVPIRRGLEVAGFKGGWLEEPKPRRRAMEP